MHINIDGEGRGGAKLVTMAIKIIEKDSDEAKCLNTLLLPIEVVLESFRWRCCTLMMVADITF